MAAASAAINGFIFAFSATKGNEIVGRCQRDEYAQGERERNHDQVEGIDRHQWRSPDSVDLKTTKPQPNQKVSLAEAQREQSRWKIRGVCSANSATLRGIISLFIRVGVFRVLDFFLA